MTEEKRKICVDCRFLSENITGIARFTLMFLKGILNPACSEKNSFKFILLLKKGTEAVLNEYVKGGFDYFIFEGEPFGFYEQFYLPWFILKENIDLYYSPYTNIPFFSGAKKVITIHDLIPLTNPEYVKGTKKYKFRKIFEFYNRIAVDKADAVLTVSKKSRKDILNIFGDNYREKVKVVKEGVEILKTNQPVSENIANICSKKYILYVGRQDPYKNILSLIKAFSLLSENFSDLFLVITGKKDERFFPEIKSEIEKLHLDDYVFFTDFINDEELDCLYKNAVCLVNPSFDEGFGLTPLECVIRGCPYCVSDIEINREILKDSALYFNPENIEDIANTIKRYIVDENLRKSYCEKGKKIAKIYTPENMAGDILKVFKNVLSS